MTKRMVSEHELMKMITSSFELKRIRALSEDEAIKDLPQIFRGGNELLWREIKSIGRPDTVRMVSDLNEQAKNYSKWDLTGIEFVRCNFKDCNFSGCDLRTSRFSNCNFTECIFDAVICGRVSERSFTAWNNCIFNHCSMKSMEAESLDASYLTFEKCNLSKSNFERGIFNIISFLKSDVSNCNFRWAEFRYGILWGETKYNGKTTFEQATFVQDKYPITNDKAHSMKYKTFWDWAFNWKRIHFLSTFPILGISWFAFVSAILIINIIQYVQNFSYPIAVPERLFWIIVSSICLGGSATIYKVKCPDLLQNFTESRWVYELKNPRPFYRVNSAGEPISRFFCMSLMIVGGFIAGALIFERLFSAMSYFLSMHSLFL